MDENKIRIASAADAELETVSESKLEREPFSFASENIKKQIRDLKGRFFVTSVKKKALVYKTVWQQSEIRMFKIENNGLKKTIENCAIEGDRNKRKEGTTILSEVPMWYVGIVPHMLWSCTTSYTSKTRKLCFSALQSN